MATPPDIVRAAYAELIVTSLAEARRFWVGLLGFAVTDEDAETLYLRGYDELTHHNLILRAGPVAAAGALGFRVRSAADLDRAQSFYAGLGCRAQRLPAGTTRGVSEIVRAEDPLGFTVEFFASAEHPERQAPPGVGDQAGRRGDGDGDGDGDGRRGRLHRPRGVGSFPIPHVSLSSHSGVAVVPGFFGFSGQQLPRPFWRQFVHR
jgi:catechol 2,3-dioxygenase-like lactoylglutathione lyase family enzyme